MENLEKGHANGGVHGEGSVFAIPNSAEPALATLRYKLPNATIDAAEQAFQAGGKNYSRGTFLVRGVDRGELSRTAAELGLHAAGLSAAPAVKSHPVRAARVALVHTWLSTQTEGWWRLALDNMSVP